MQENKDIPLHFILCKERTGSSILTTMLNSSDSILCASEEPFLLYFHKHYKNTKIWTPKKIENFIDQFWLMHEKNLNLYFSSKEDAKAKLLTLSDKKMSYLEFCKYFYLQFYREKEKSNIQTILDKQLKYLFYFEEIKKISPGSKFIILTREPKDNIAACINRKLGKSQKVSYQASIWNNYYKSISQLKENTPDNILFIRYEDLILSPEDTLQSVCNFIQEEYNPEMISFHSSYGNFIKTVEDNVSTEIMEGLKDFHSSLLKPVDKSKIGMWKNSLSEEEGKLIDSITKETAEKFGYNPGAPKVKLTFRDKYYISLATFHKKWVLYIYKKIPFGIKLIIKKIRYQNKKFQHH